MTVKVTSICDGKVCYEPVESVELPFIGPARPTEPLPFIGPARPPSLLLPRPPQPSPVPRAVPAIPGRKLAKPTWISELLRLLYETEMGRGPGKLPKLPPIRVRR